MVNYALQRMFYALLTLWGIATTTFLLMHALPGVPFNHPERLTPAMVANLNHLYGLDQSLWSQYVAYLGHVVHGNFGESFSMEGWSVRAVILTYFPVSLELGLQAFAVALVVGMALGLSAGLRPTGVAARLSAILAGLGMSVPSLMLGPLLSYYAGVRLGWLPAGLWDGYSSTILPTLTLALLPLAYVARMTAASVRNVLKEDFIRTATSKGLPPFALIGRHVIRNATAPLLTYAAPLLVHLITGSIVVEQAFSIPGIGHFFVESIMSKDYTLLMGITLFYAVLYIVSTLVVDLLYALLDPRARIWARRGGEIG